MSLRDELVKNAPRERGGSIAKNRITFEQTWVLCKILEIHWLFNDYLIGIEIHDDVFIANDSQNPTEIDFYQIKTKSIGEKWTVNMLTNKTNSKSIIGKMYDNYYKMKKYTKSLNLVSNIHFNLKFTSNEFPTKNSKIQCSLLHKDCLDKIRTAICKEYTINHLNSNVFDKIFFEVTNFDINNHEEFALGKISNFFDEYTNGKAFNPKQIYRAFIDEIIRRGRKEESSTSFEDMKKNHSLTKEYVSKMINIVSQQGDNLEEIMKEINKDLGQENKDWNYRQNIQSGCKKYRTNRADRNNSIFNLIIDKIKIIITNLDIEKTLSETLNKYYDEYCKSSNMEQNVFNTTDIQAFILMEYYEKQSR